MTRGRPIIVLFLVLSLALAGFARRWAWDARDAINTDPLAASASGAPQSASAGSLSNMNSFALGLLLGGLRGPLVMFLWSSSESQKADHDLEDFDTKVEWIRLLQPEFDTVHLFEIWNKAYNISVQMANLPDKYATILDAIDYAQTVDSQRPDDINIIYQIGMTFGDKLAGPQLPIEERQYYLRRTCQDTQWPRPLTRVTLPEAKLDDFISAAHAAGMDLPSEEIQTDENAGTAIITVESSIADAIKPKFAGVAEFKELPRQGSMAGREVKRTRLDPMLDEKGNLLPSLLAPTHPRPADLAADQPWYDGSRLQFLKKYEPYPYGISPTALSFNYYKRAQELSALYHEEHIQTSDFVVDSRPALALKAWSEAEGEGGRRAELRLFGIDDSGDRPSLETRAPGADNHKKFNPAEWAHRPDPAAGNLAIFSYGRAARLCRDAYAEYNRHIVAFPSSRKTFISHEYDMLAFAPLYQADCDFLIGLLDKSRRTIAFRQAIDEYTKAKEAFDLVIFRYYTEGQVAEKVFPIDPTTGDRYTQLTIDQYPADQRDALLAVILKVDSDYMSANHRGDQFYDDRLEYLDHIRRATERLVMLQTR